MRRLLLHLPGARDPVVVRVGLALLDKLGSEHIDRRAVLGVHHRQQPGVCRDLHGLENLRVIRVEDARVGHEHLEARDAFVDEARHRGERVLVNPTDNLVEAVVDGAITGSEFVPVREAVFDALAGALHREVDDRGGAAPGGGGRAGLERVACRRATERQLHVGVGVDAARDHILAGRVDHGVDRVLQVAAEQHRSGCEHRDDALTVDEHIRFTAASGRDDGTAGDEGRSHDGTPRALCRRLSARKSCRSCQADGHGRTASHHASAAPSRGRGRG